MLAIKNGKILDGTGRVIDDGTILIKEGKIHEIGNGDMEIPNTYDILDAKGYIVT
ncbi:amidohydrolase, partial [Salmonella enterica subsp. enterica serovar Typhi]|nr:amidohydrolase [Salmonella enterica subsp. enterica serovar Typhi]